MGTVNYEYCAFCKRATGRTIFHERGRCFEYRSPWEYVGGGQWRNARKFFGDVEKSERQDGS